MNIHKLGKGRFCFSLRKYFFKIILAKNTQEINVISSKSMLSAFLAEKETANQPRVFFQTNIFGIHIEICERIKDAQPLSDEHEAFYNRVTKALPNAKAKYGNTSWQSLLNPGTLKYIKSKLEIYEYIEGSLKKEQYPNTGMHGDLNPNNILIGPDQNFWIVDWENCDNNGSIVWDLYWFYGNWKRNTSKPAKDIISIYNHTKKPDIKIRETLLIYALMKVRIDLQRHNKSMETALDNFFQRVAAIMDICQTSENKTKRTIQNENK